jgi:uncharacterized membrane protein
MKWIHIIAGLMAIASGAFALYSAKGSPLHRKSGTVFTVSMLVMALSAAFISIFLRTDHITGVVGLFTAYLVCTAWLVVKRTVPDSRALMTGFALGAMLIGVYALSLWFDFRADPKSLITRNSPPPALLVFGTLSFLCAALDVRTLWAGQITGKHRLLRHLWRMCFAMLIATGSFFAGQMQVFPTLIRKAELAGMPVLVYPVLLVLVTMLYWIGRTVFKRKRLAIKPAA